MKTKSIQLDAIIGRKVWRNQQILIGKASSIIDNCAVILFIEQIKGSVFFKYGAFLYIKNNKN